MKKRLTSLCLCLCLMISALPALAEEDGALRVLNNSWWAAEAYQEQYPDRKVEVIQPEYIDDGANTNLKELLYTEAWDVACIDTDEISLKALDEAGLLADLTAYFGGERLYPAIRGAVSVEGRMLGMPVCMWYTGAYHTMCWLGRDENGVGARLGLTPEDEPHTYPELQALAEKYFAMDAEQRRGTVFMYDMLDGSAGVRLLAGFISQYAGQFADAQGNVNYDTDAFRDGAAQIERLEKLLGEHAKPLYEKGSTRLLAVVRDAANHPLGNQTLFHIGEERRIPAKLEVWVVNAHTERPNEALDLIRAAVKDGQSQWMPALYADFDYEALLRESYDRDIEAQIEQQEEQSVIDELIRRRDAGDDSHYYTREEIAAYRENTAPYLIFPLCGWVDSWKAAERYLHGELDMDGMIAALNGQS